jgi:hypothetical protein
MSGQLFSIFASILLQAGFLMLVKLILPFLLICLAVIGCVYQSTRNEHDKEERDWSVSLHDS